MKNKKFGISLIGSGLAGAALAAALTPTRVVPAPPLPPREKTCLEAHADYYAVNPADAQRLCSEIGAASVPVVSASGPEPSAPIGPPPAAQVLP